MKEKFQILFSQLQTGTECSDSIFSEMHIILSSTSTHNLLETLRAMDLDPRDAVRFILPHLRVTKVDGLPCLQKIMQSLNPAELVAMDNTLILGLNHSSADVQEIFLKELQRCIEDNKALAVFLQNPPLLNTIAKLISDDNASVAKHSANLVTLLCNQHEFGQAFLASLKSAFHELLNGAETIRFRFYQLIVAIASPSPASLQAVADDYLAKLILESRKCQDILIQLNSIELLTELALFPHGLAFLQQRGVLQQFKHMLQESISNPLSSFFLPGLLRFFGHIGVMNPDEVTCIVPVVMAIVKTYDSSLQGIAIETIGAIGTSNMGKTLLHANSSEMQECVEVIGRVIDFGESEQRVRAIDALIRLLTIQENNISREVDSILEKWYRSIDKDPTRKFVNLCKQPFQEMKLGALDILGRLASTEWGQKELVSQPGFLEYLLDRSTDHEKEGKEKKYIIVREIVQSSMASAIFSTDILMKLKRYAQEGPFFIQVETAVGFESSE